MRGRSWPRAGRGMSNRPDGNGDGDSWMKGGEGKQCRAAASRPQPALTHPVEEEEGCTSRTEEKYKQCL